MTDLVKPVTGQGMPPTQKTELEELREAVLAMKEMVQIQLQERQDLLLERQEKARAILEKEKQRRINSEIAIGQKNKIQAICTHRKGGKRGPNPFVDYAVYYHTFTDQSRYIKCQICAATWKPHDTVEFLIRQGKKIPNHTQMGWKEAFALLSKSTNTPTASEVIHDRPKVDEVDIPQ